MLLSKQITEDNKFPNFISSEYAFRSGDKKFDKVFSHIGLANSEADIKDIKPDLLYAMKNSLTGIRVNLPVSKKNWLKNFVWTLVGTPLMFADLLLDYNFLRRFRKKQKDFDLKVVFSASDKDGAWDIATMSMRGITSCQSWNGGHRHSLVGSIIDPCCGIIYLTNGKKTKYGREMMYRAIVRYIVDPSIGPCLFMERTYPVSKTSAEIRAVNMLFGRFLSEKTKLPIVYDYCLAGKGSPADAFIPSSSVVHENVYVKSYRDSGIEYRNINEELLKDFPQLRDIQKKYFD